MRKKELISGGLVLLLILSGCTETKNEEKVQEKEPIVLSVLAGQSTSDAGVEDMIDEKIAEVFPDVKLEWECVDWGESFDAKVRVRFAAGDIPDIMIGKAQDVKTYYSTGNLSAIDAELVEGIKEEALSPVEIGGQYYGLPFNAWYQGVIYHKEIFRSLGLQTPRTQEEMSFVIKTLEEQGITPFASHYLESWKVGNTTMQFMINDIFSRNPCWGEDFRRGSVSYSGDEKIAACMQNNMDILEHSWEDALLIDQFTCDDRFEQGEAVMYLTGSWSLQFENQYATDNEYGIFPYPNQEGNSRLIRETNMTFMKGATTEYPDLVDDILNILIHDSGLMKEILEFTQTYSVREETGYDFQSCIQEDIDYYENSGQIIEAATGNSQLVWAFQNDVAAQELLWLQGKQTLDEVLQYADLHRGDSIS